MPGRGRGDEERYFIGHDEWANERGNGALGREGVLEKRSFERLIYKMTLKCRWQSCLGRKTKKKLIPMPGRGDEERYFIGHDDGQLGGEGVLEKRSFERLIYKLTTPEMPLPKLNTKTNPMTGRGNEERYFTGHDEWANERTVGKRGCT